MYLPVINVHAQHLTDHDGVVMVELIITDGPPLALVVNLQTTLVLTRTVHQSYRRP